MTPQGQFFLQYSKENSLKEPKPQQKTQHETTHAHKKTPLSKGSPKPGTAVK